jgi:hypothetical protein
MPPSELAGSGFVVVRAKPKKLDELEAEDSMKSAKFGAIGRLIGCAALMANGTAVAQTAAATTTTTTTTTPVAAPAPASSPPAPTQTGMALPGATPDAVGGNDHDLMVGHFGVGYMGLRSIGINVTGGGAVTTVDAPVIGARYWLDPMIGIDAGLGLNFTGRSIANNPGGTTDLQGYSVFILHGGVPLALAGSKHFSFQVVPELNLGFSSSTVAGGPADVDLNGFHFDLGARAGTEIQFGFIGIPELSLQAGIGLAFSYDRIKATTKTTPETSAAYHQTALGTSVGDNPWNIFTGNIAALYYFH